jgi:hypothetical protein
MFAWKQRIICLLLAGFIISITACQGQQSAETEQWLPPYLRLQLRAGKVQVQWPDSSEWAVMEGRASIAVEEEIGMIADAVEGAQFRLGDGSALELAPQATVQLQNLRTFPRLHVVLQEGALLFVAQDSTYEFVVPACLVTILSVPARLNIEIDDEGTHLIVKEGVAACTTDTETITLPPGQEVHMASSDAQPEITEYTDAGATATVLALTPSPKPTTTPTSSPTDTPTPTPTPRPTVEIVIPTSTQVPPTEPPTNPPPPPSKPRPTNPPPTKPPPPAPTEPPPPPATKPPRPTPTPGG